MLTASPVFIRFQLPPSYEQRQCHEYMKLGLMGTTFCFSSGDWGVAGYGGEYCLANEEGTELTNGKSGIFVPTFPSTCPYVLSVGGTQIKNHTVNALQQIQAGKQVEVAMELTLNAQGLIG